MVPKPNKDRVIRTMSGKEFVPMAKDDPRRANIKPENLGYVIGSRMMSFRPGSIFAEMRVNALRQNHDLPLYAERYDQAVKEKSSASKSTERADQDISREDSDSDSDGPLVSTSRGRSTHQMTDQFAIDLDEHAAMEQQAALDQQNEMIKTIMTTLVDMRDMMAKGPNMGMMSKVNPAMAGYPPTMRLPSMTGNGPQPDHYGPQTGAQEYGTRQGHGPQHGAHGYAPQPGMQEYGPQSGVQGHRVQHAVPEYAHQIPGMQPHEGRGGALGYGGIRNHRGDQEYGGGQGDEGGRAYEGGQGYGGVQVYGGAQGHGGVQGYRGVQGYGYQPSSVKDDRTASRYHSSSVALSHHANQQAMKHKLSEEVLAAEKRAKRKKEKRLDKNGGEFGV